MDRVLRAASLAVLATFLSCAPVTPPVAAERGAIASGELLPRAEVAPAPAPAAPPDDALGDGAAIPVILVVLDGVRWQEIFGGVDPFLAARHHAGPVVGPRELLPALYGALDARGAILGAPGHGTISASGPNFFSLPGYTEIFAGRPSDGCHDNGCAGATGPTLVDAFRDRARDDSDVAVIASWAPIAKAATRDPSRVVISAGRKRVWGDRYFAEEPALLGPLEEGARADPRPGHDTFRPDRYTAEIALRYLEAKSPSFLFVGLGEADEYAHQDDYRGYLGALRATDVFFARLFATLERMGERGRRTVVLVTADHGRGHDYRDHGGGLPESARVWLLAIGETVRARGYVDGPTPRHLADIAPTIREMVGIDPIRAPERSGSERRESAGTKAIDESADFVGAGRIRLPLRAPGSAMSELMIDPLAVELSRRE